MIIYNDQKLNQADALTALCADLDVLGHSTLWRFAPECPALVAVQVHAADARGLAPPMPNRPRTTYSVAAGPDLITRCEAGRTPVEWGYNDESPVVVFRRDAPSRWPRTLGIDELEGQARALRGWFLDTPWPLPAAWCAAWAPLAGVLRDEAVRRFEAARHRRPPRAREPLLTLIGRTVALTKQGRQYAGLCPFHDDRQPSLRVHPDKGWYCWVCQRGGQQGTWIQALREGV